jgi:hypothetical protein
VVTQSTIAVSADLLSIHHNTYRITIIRFAITMRHGTIFSTALALLRSIDLIAAAAVLPGSHDTTIHDSTRSTESQTSALIPRDRKTVEDYDLQRIPISEGNAAAEFIHPHINDPDEDFTWSEFQIINKKGDNIHLYQVSADQGGYTTGDVWLAPPGYKPGDNRYTDMNLHKLFADNWKAFIGSDSLAGLKILGIEEMVNQETIDAMKAGFKKQKIPFAYGVRAEFEDGNTGYYEFIYGNPFAKSILKMCEVNSDISLNKFIGIGGVDKRSIAMIALFD